MATTSIRTRLIISLLLLIAPLGVLLHGTLALNRSVLVVEQTVNEPVLLLRYSLGKTSFFGERFFLDMDIDAAETFFALQREVQGDYENLLGNDVLGESTRRSVLESWKQWQEAQRIAEALSSEALTRQRRESSPVFRRWKEYMSGASETLLQESLLSQEEARERAEASRTEADLLLARVQVILGISIFMAAAAAFILRRAILAPLAHLRRGVRAVERGDLSHRVSTALPSEFQELSSTFNRMTEKIAELTVRDELTGLFNRRALNRRLDEEMARADRYEHPLSVLMMDIDHFKTVNDRFGHQAGDAVLRQVAQRIVGAVRPTDWVARYGGEEIAAILPETDTPSAGNAAERVRVAVEHEPFLLDDGTTVPVTLSIGVATFPRHGREGYALVSAADESVYRAKREGRNCVRVHGS